MADLQARPSRTPSNPGRAAQVLEAATTLFADRGYHGTTMNDIADVVGIRQPSLYKHVSSKQDVLVEIVSSTMEGLLAEQLRALEQFDAPPQRLREMIRAAVAFHLDHRLQVSVVIRELPALGEAERLAVEELRSLYWRRTREVVAAGVEQGLFRVESEAVTTFSIVHFANSPVSWFRDERSSVSRTEVADQVADMALRMAGYTEDRARAARPEDPPDG